MKKNFVKKLALGLAFTVAVSSVPTTNAAAAETVYPSFKSVTTKENRKVLEVGKTKKYNTKNSEKWALKRINVGNDDIAIARFSKTKKFIKITGVAAGKTQVRAVFKNYKTKEVYKDVLLHVEVKAEEETKAIALESVQATGVKKLVVNFNQAVDTTKATVTVKKGTVSPNVASTVWAEDGKSVTLNMGSKLTKGTYDVSVAGLTETALTGNVAVEDETLTAIEFVGTNLVADPEVASTASISFKTLNQYGERMATSVIPTATSSFSSKAEVTTVCTAKQNGVITVTDIPTMFQILGTTGTVTLVDTTKGVTQTANVAYSAPASAKTMTVAGLYNMSKSKVAELTKGDTISDYYVLAQVKDQYGNDLDKAFLNEEATKITATLIPGGNVAGVDKEWEDITIDGVDYVGLKLVAGQDKDTEKDLKAGNGTFYITFVNEKVGLLANTTFTVNAGTVIKTLNIYANDTLYEGQANELGFEAIDADGNPVTKYSALVGNIALKATREDLGDKIEFVKQADGSAKLVYTPAEVLVSTESNPNNKQSTIVSFTASVNDVSTSNYFVKPLTLTVSQKRVPVEVVGIKSGAATAVASGSSMNLALSNILVEDQYANVMTIKEVVGAKDSVVIKKVVDKDDDKANLVLPEDGVNTFADSTKATIEVKAKNSAANDVTTFVLNIGSFTDEKGKDKTNNYELKLYTVDSKKASNLTIQSVNSNYVVKAATGTSVDYAGNPGDLKVNNVKITGVVGGKTVEIPDTQYQVSGNTGYAIDVNKNPQTTQTGTIEVTVDTVDGPVVLTKEYTFSNAKPVLTTLTADGVNTVTVTDGKLSANELKTAFFMDDQYGTNKDAGDFSDAGVKYTIVDVTNNRKEDLVINYNSTNDVEVTKGYVGKFTVTATKGDLTVTKTITVE